jgi:hypothetical protein
MTRRLRQNPRLIPLDRKTIREIADSWCKEISKETERALKSVKFFGLEEEPLALFDDDLPAWERTYEIATLTKGREYPSIKFKLRLAPTRVSREIQQHIADGGEVSCSPGQPVGAHIQAWAGVPMRDMRQFVITVEMCPTTTLELLRHAGESREFKKDVYEYLLHEITHASEHGAVDAGSAKYETPKTGGGEAAYYNHPWELRAHARQIAEDVIGDYEHQIRVDKARKRTGKKVQLPRDSLGPGAVLDLYLEVSERFSRVWPHLTPENQKKLIQYVARELQEQGLT